MLRGYGALHAGAVAAMTAAHCQWRLAHCRDTMSCHLAANSKVGTKCYSTMGMAARAAELPPYFSWCHRCSIAPTWASHAWHKALWESCRAAVSSQYTTCICLCRRFLRFCCYIICCRGSCDAKRDKNNIYQLLFSKRMKILKVGACQAADTSHFSSWLWFLQLAPVLA